MPTRTDEVSFATFVATQRPLLQRIAYLMYGDVGQGTSSCRRDDGQAL